MLVLLFWQLTADYQQADQLEAHYASQNVAAQALRLEALLEGRAAVARTILDSVSAPPNDETAASVLLSRLGDALPSTRSLSWLDQDGNALATIGEPRQADALRQVFQRFPHQTSYFFQLTDRAEDGVDLLIEAENSGYWVIHIASEAINHWLDEAGLPETGWALVNDKGTIRQHPLGGEQSTRHRLEEASFPLPGTGWHLKTVPIASHGNYPSGALVAKTLLYALCSVLTLIALGALLREQRMLRALTTASRRSLNQAASALSAIEEPVLVSEADGTLHYLNRRAEQMFGISAAGASGVSLLQLLPQLSGLLDVSPDKGSTETIQVRRNGEFRLFTVNRSLVGTENDPTGYVWVLRDVTEAHQALSTLEETRRRYQDIFEGSGVGLCVLDLSALLAFIQHRQFGTVEALTSWLAQSPENEAEIKRRIRITEANAMAIRLLGSDSLEGLNEMVDQVPMVPESARYQIITALIMGLRFVETEVRFHNAPGERHVWMTMRLPEDERDYQAVTVSLNDITSRKNVELSLIDRERFWSGIAYAVPDTLYVLDLQTQQHLFSNGKLGRLLGYDEFSLVEAGQAGWDRLLHPDDRALYESLRARQQSLQPEQLLQCQVRLAHQDGTWRWFDVREQALVHDGDGRPSRLIGIAKDITEQIEASESLRSSEQRYRLLAESISDVIFCSDALLRLNYISPSVDDMLGYTPDELLESGVGSIIANPQQMVGLTSLMARVQTGLKHPAEMVRLREEVSTQHMVVDCLRSDGRKVPVEVRIVLMWDDAGNFQGLLGVGRDISRQRRAEKDMRMAATVFEHSTAAILVTDPAGYIVQVNRAFSRITGYQTKEILDQSPAMLTADRQQANHLKYIIGQLDISGSWEGEVWLKRRNGETYPAWVGITAVQDEEGDLVSYVCFFSDIGERKASEQRIHRLAYYDALTQLPNRTLFQDRLHTALQTSGRNGGWVALMFLDLDRFKPINDSLGHAAGDRMLKDVAQRLSGCVDQEDTVARMGGDEFTLLLRAAETRENALTRAIHVAERILASLSRAFVLEGREFFVSASIGIALSPQDGNELSQLMKNADTAMYHAKEMGKNNFQFYQADMNARALERLELESDLRHALDNGQFQLYYQPQLSGDGRRLTGVEALLRWQHPSRGFVSPAEFVPVLEELGLVVQVGDWALAEACTQLKAWHSRKVRVPKVSVNLSARQFGDGHLSTRIARILETSGLPPSCLELELTESILMHDIGETLALLDGLKQLGLCIAVDDFGTGYSSLNYLKQFPIDVLKIDRSFVDGLPDGEQDAQIARAIIAMAHSLNLTVIAEGVETQAQLDFLREHGCDEVQGFLFGKPMPADHIEALYSNDALFMLE
ncbi:bifunctional diguanylate cyclase/phosphodiesterase [Pseudomonas sp. Marseille-QA0892]